MTQETTNNETTVNLDAAASKEAETNSTSAAANVPPVESKPVAKEPKAAEPVVEEKKVKVKTDTVDVEDAVNKVIEDHVKEHAAKDDKKVIGTIQVEVEYLPRKTTEILKEAGIVVGVAIAAAGAIKLIGKLCSND